MTIEEKPCSKKYVLWREELDRKGGENTGLKCHHSHFTKPNLQCTRLGKQKVVVDLGCRWMG